MIPDITFEVIKDGFGHLGTASNDKMPAHTDTLGAVVNDTKDSITFFVESLYQNKCFQIYKIMERQPFLLVSSHMKRISSRGSLLR